MTTSSLAAGVASDSHTNKHCNQCLGTLQSIEEEKEKTAAELQEREQETLQLQEENKRLSETTFLLQTGLEVRGISGAFTN